MEHGLYPLIDLYHGMAILTFSNPNQCNHTEAGRKTFSLVSLSVQWILVFVTVIRYREHDQDGGSMIKVYCVFTVRLEYHEFFRRRCFNTTGNSVLKHGNIRGIPPAAPYRAWYAIRLILYTALDWSPVHSGLKRVSA